MKDLNSLWDAARQATVPREIDVPHETLEVALERAAATWPDRVAVDFLGAETTYAELAQQASVAAAVLRDRGVRKGDRVAIALPNCTTHAALFYAVLRLGAIVVSINPTLTPSGIRHQMSDSGAVILIAWEKTLERLEPRTGDEPFAAIPVDIAADLPLVKRLALRLPLPSVRRKAAALRSIAFPGVQRWHQLQGAASPLDPEVERAQPEDIALFQYTGGTTGTPKAAMLTHRNVVANGVQSTAWTGAPLGSEVIFGVLPYFHAFGMLLCLVYAVRIGATVATFPQFSPEEFLKTQKRRPGTFLPAVPPMLDRIAEAAEKSGADLRSFAVSLSGSMALPTATAERWERLTGGLVIEGYGLTETSPVAVGNPLSAARRPGTLGIPYPSTEVRVVDPENPTVEVPFGASGELLIRGPQVFSGYWNLPEETASQLLPGGWLRTGDVVQLSEDGFIVLVDRIKELIVTGGYKVYPSQVEEHLRRMPGVKDVAVVGLPGGDLGEKVVAAIVMEEDHLAVGLDTVREWCGEKFAKYALPRGVVILPDLPRSQIGKVLRRAVKLELMAPTP